MEPFTIVAITFGLGVAFGAAGMGLLWLTKAESAVLDKLARGEYRQQELRRSRRAYTPPKEHGSAIGFHEGATKVVYKKI